MSKRRDTDFLYISSLVRAKENSLLTSEQVERMIEAKSDEEAVRVLEECGYEGIAGLDSLALERQLTARLDAIFQELVARSPDSELVDIFRLKYDYHNAKVLVKAEAADIDGRRLMSGSGRVDPDEFADSYYQQTMAGLTPALAAATVEAKEVLARTKDAQLADIVLDKGFYAEFLATAEAAESEFLSGYVRISIDGANLRTAVRAGRMELSNDLLGQVLIEGGNVATFSILEAVRRGESVESLFASGPLAGAAAAAADVDRPGGLTAFERQCDNALIAYMKKAKFVPFGDAPLIAYVGAVEQEISTVRIVMNSRAAGLEPAAIRERLRDSYV